MMRQTKAKLLPRAKVRLVQHLQARLLALTAKQELLKEGLRLHPRLVHDAAKEAAPQLPKAEGELQIERAEKKPKKEKDNPPLSFQRSITKPHFWGLVFFHRKTQKSVK